MADATTTHGIGAAADALNAAIERAEKALSSLRLGARAGVPLEAEGDARLEFGKLSDRWQLVLVDGESVSRLTATSLETRVRAAAALPALLAALRLESVAQVREVREAARLVDAFAAAVSEEGVRDAR